MTSSVFFQTRSTVAGCDELCVGFYPIRNGEIVSKSTAATKTTKALFCCQPCADDGASVDFLI